MKRGAWTDHLGEIILLVVFLFLIFGFIYLYYVKPSGNIKSTTMEIQWKQCRAQGEKLLSEGVEFTHGEDNFPYSCAPCVGGNNFEDQDADGMPDDCDKEPMNNKVVECKDRKPTKDGRCCVNDKWLTWCCPFTKEYEKNTEACKTE